MKNILNPERQKGESHEAYRDRRQTAADYVDASKQGDLHWSSREQGTFVNQFKTQERIFGKGKAARRALKMAKRMQREQSLDL